MYEMDIRIDKTTLLNTLSQWDRFLKRKVHCIACGGVTIS